MPGIFSKQSRPLLAGTYFDFLISQPSIPAPSAGKTVAIGLTHTWGPFKTATLCTSFADFLDKFGGLAGVGDPTNPTSGYIAVKEAFLGEAAPGFGGAGAVIVYRMGAPAAAKGTRTLQNTTPATALTVSAKYEGTTGNQLRLTTQDYAADATQNQLIVSDANGVVLETYTYLDTDINGLAAQINANSDWITAAVNINGTALAVVTSVALTGGNDGTTLTTTEYNGAMAALEVQRFGVLVFENLTDGPTQALVKTWAQGQNSAGRRFFTVVGGSLDEAITAAVTRSGTFNDPDFLNIGVGSVRDYDTLDVNGVPLVLSTAQLAPRIAGILANRGVRMSMTFAKLPGLQIINGPTASDVAKAYDGGVIVLGRASDADATVRIEKGLTTFTTKTDPNRPRAVFSRPKFVEVMHELQNELALWADENIIGRSTVDDETRAAVLAQLNATLTSYQALGAVQPGWSAFVDPVPPPSDSDEFVAFVIAAKFGRSTEQVYFSGQLG